LGGLIALTICFSAAVVNSPSFVMVLNIPVTVFPFLLHGSTNGARIDRWEPGGRDAVTLA
jgi:hypothetical protein